MPVNLARAAARPFKALFVSDAREGVLLIAVALLAVWVANSPYAHDYRALFDTPLGWSPIPHLPTLHAWINDGLMAVFFFVVGLEVKREVTFGSLADPRARRLPVAAALAGMAAPAAVYVAIAGGEGALARGWAIPAATDIAFAMGVVGLLGRRVSPGLRVFLLTVAIVDDIGAVAIIAVVYSGAIDALWLAAAAAVLAAMIALNRLRVTAAWPYLALALGLWVAVLHSGVHATIAGIAAALAVPQAGRRNLAEVLEHRLVGWNAYLVVPLFGFANAGVALSGLPAGGLFAPLPLAVAAGLVVGKQAGIFGSVWLAERSGFAPRPGGAAWAEVWGIALLCGIGFTMSLFIGGLAFPGHPHLMDQAKLGVLAGTLVSALLGYSVLRLVSPVRPA